MDFQADQVHADGDAVSQTDGTLADAISIDIREPGHFVVMTYNILTDLPFEDFYAWEIRKHHVADAIMRHQPDLIGVQEPFIQQITDLLALCPQYAAVYKEEYSDPALFYLKDRFTVIDTGLYWLSPTPDKAFSNGFGNIIPRMVLWAEMEETANHKRFYFITTHFDATSPCQEKSAPLVLERTQPMAEELPVIMIGDFNSKPDSTAYRILTGQLDGNGFHLDDAFAAVASFGISTNVSPEPTYNAQGRIDHIFTAGGTFTIDAWTVDIYTYGEENRYPSDHFPIIVDMELK